MNKDVSGDIIGCLDYALRHSNHFSGVQGESLDNLLIDFTDDEGLRCELKVQVEILKTDDSEIEPKWSRSDKESARFIELAKLYLEGDSSVFAADSPADLAKGFIRELPNGRAEYARMHFADFKKHPDIVQKLEDRRLAAGKSDD